MNLKNKTNLLCVDDEPDIESTCRRLRSKGKLTLSHRRPNPDWTSEVEAIHEEMTKGEYDGLLIDFRLDETHSGKKTQVGNKYVKYTAESLVPELRRLSVEGGKDESYPIVLWSTAAFLSTFYELNPGYNASYDAIWDKQTVSNDYPRYQLQLASLCGGYRTLNNAIQKRKLDMKGLLGAYEDMSVLTEFDQHVQKKGRGSHYAFQFSLFIRHDVLEVPGPLVNHCTFLAFLGVEKLDPKSEKLLLSHIGKNAVYRGVFSDSYVRYWREKLVSNLEDFTGVSSWLSLPAAERIKLLNSRLKALKLTAAKPISKDYATDYDTYCIVTKRPLAKRNGFRLLNTRPLPWRNGEYIAGSEYRLNFSEFSKTLPLEAEDKERFAIQYNV